MQRFWDMKAKSNQEHLGTIWVIIFAVLVVLIFLGISFIVVDPVEHPNSDFFSFWLVGRMILSGENPYDSDLWIQGHYKFGASWISDLTFLYPLPISGLFVPLGFLPLYQAFQIWVTFSEAMIFLSILVLTKLQPMPRMKHLYFPILSGVILFRPTIITLHNGQLTGFLLIVLTLIVYYWYKGKWCQGSLLLPIIGLKPQLGIPIILLLSLYLLFLRETKGLYSIGISGLGILIIGWAIDPDWIYYFLQTGNSKLLQTFGFSPTVWGISNYLCHFQANCMIILGLILSMLLGAWVVFLLVKYRKRITPEIAISFSIVLTLILTPYTWPYDQLLLVIPIVIVMLGLASAGFRFLFISLIFISVDILAFIFLAISLKIQLEAWNVIIPFIVLLLLVGYLTRVNVKLAEVEYPNN